MSINKTIVEKLNLNKYPAKLILNQPEDINDFNVLTYDSSIEKEKYDLIFIFTFSLDDFTDKLKEIVNKQLVNKNGYVYFAYPKKNNPRYKEYIERDHIVNQHDYDEEAYVYGSDLKFSRMVSLNEVFTVIGLKCEPKKTKNTKTQKVSQCVDDYVEHIKDINQYLKKNKKLLTIYKVLTLGYQKDWARYVYSAQKEETKNKRLKEMENILAEGYKTIDLYRRKKK